MIFYYNDYGYKTLNCINSSIYDVETIKEVLKESDDNNLLLSGYSNNYAYIQPTDTGLIIRTQSGYVVQKIVGIK